MQGGRAAQLMGVGLFVIGVFATILVLGVMVPIYADEVGLRMMRTGFFSENQRALTLLPQCGHDLGLPIPLSWYPAAIVVSLSVAGLPPIGVRVLGIATALFWVCLLAVLLRFLVKGRYNQIAWLAGISAILGLGVLPLTLILSRSEQWLLVLLTFLIILPIFLVRSNQPRSGWIVIGLFAVFCMAISLALYAHPKALFFSPLFAVSAYYIFRGKSNLAFWSAITFLLWSTYETVQFAQLTVACPDAPIFRAYMASQTTKLGLFEAPIATLGEFWGNLLAAPGANVKHLLFQPVYQSAWLPPGSGFLDQWPARLANLAISGVFQLVIWVAVLLPLAALGLSIKRRDFGCLFFMIMALSMGLIAHLAVYKVWNFYGSVLVIGLTLILILLSVVQLRWIERASYFWLCLYIGLTLVFLGSVIVLATSVIPEMYKAIDSKVVGLEKQPISVSPFGFSKQRTKIREFAAGCSLQGDGAQRLVVDDLTYFAFDNLREPLHLVYFYEGGFGADVKGMAAVRMLQKLEIEGIVARCTFMPGLLKERVRRDGNLCCIKFPIEDESD